MLPTNVHPREGHARAVRAALWAAAALAAAALSSLGCSSQVPCGPAGDCPPGLRCSRLGSCEPDPCHCSADQTCIGDTCLPRSCPEALSDGGTLALTCMAGAACAGGECATANCPRPCLPDQQCANGACRDRTCFGGVSCPEGMICQGGTCATAACANVDCGPGQSCVAGACEAAVCPGTSCREGEVCRDGTCVQSACVGIPCPAGERCGNGRCSPIGCGGAPCGDGLVCAGGACVTLSCAGVTCPEGSLCANGHCYPLLCPDLPCAGGSVCASGSCVEQRCAGVTCSYGTPCFQGACMPDTDGDGVVDAKDNCPDVYNPDQANADGDPAGAACDCADNDPARYPGNPEVCDGKDNNCDGQIDEGVKLTFYRDADGDGSGDPASSVLACAAPAGYVANALDCNDGDGTLNPDTVWYGDADGDTYGDPSATQKSCTQPPGYIRRGGDCNDGDSNIHPGVPDVCDGVDNDCDGQTDENPDIPWYRDADGDGYGNPNQSTLACSQPAGYVSNSLDCNDADGTLNPDTVWFRDADGDTYGDPSATQKSCTQPVGYVRRAGDCNDGDLNIHPGVPDVCDGIDNDCDGQTDEDPDIAWYADADGDGYGATNATAVMACANPDPNPAALPAYVRDHTDCDDTHATVHPGAPEICGDGLDNDCDGTVDDKYAARATPIGAVSESVGSSGTANGTCTATSLTATGTTNYAVYYQDAASTSVLEKNGTPHMVSSCVRADFAATAFITRVSFYREAAGTRSQDAPACYADGTISGGGNQDVLLFGVDANNALVLLYSETIAGCTGGCGGGTTRTIPPPGGGFYGKAVVLCRNGSSLAANNLRANALSVSDTCSP